MFCTFCGKKLDNEAKFCSQCGREIKRKTSQINTRIEVQKDNKENIMQIFSLLMIILGNFLCMASNFIPIYCEQELGASYTYNIWAMVEYVGYYESGQEFVFKWIVVPLILATFFSGIFFIMLMREKKDIKIVEISKLSMICEIIYVVLVYISVDYVDTTLMDSQSFSKNGFMLFAVAFLNLVYFQREYSKYLEKQDEKLDVSDEAENKSNGLDIAVITFAILIVCIFVIFLSKVIFSNNK